MALSPLIRIHDPSPTFVPDYMPWAILELISLCFPLGTLAMIFCVLANFAKRRNQIDRARRWARVALILIIIGFILGLTIKIFLAFH